MAVSEPAMSGRTARGALKGRLPAEIGALVIKVLDAAVNDPTVRDVSAETPAKQPEFGLIGRASDEHFSL
jgi:hypothetical protein